MLIPILLSLFALQPAQAKDLNACKAALTRTSWKTEGGEILARWMRVQTSPAKVASLSERWQSVAELSKKYPWVELTSIGPEDPRFVPFQRALKRINQKRVEPSRTVGGDEGRAHARRAAENWDRAEALIGRWVKDGTEVTAARIRQLNAVIGAGLKNNGSEPGQYRDFAIYAGSASNREYLPLEDLKRAMNDFTRWVAETEASENPVQFAGEAYQRLVSIHPFPDANGRTTRAVMDWILEKHGLPPATFQKTSDAMVAVFTKLPPSKNPMLGRAAVVATSAVEETLSIIAEEMDEEARLTKLRANHIHQIAPRLFEVLVPAENDGEYKIVNVKSVERAMRLLKDVDEPIDVDALIAAAERNYRTVAELVGGIAELEPEAQFYSRVKKADSLREKIFDWARDFSPNFRMEDIVDLVGTRLVARDSAQASRLAARARNLPGVRLLYDRKIFLSSGYEAVHIGAEMEDTGQLLEIQVMTERMERWSSWFHDRHYKPSPDRNDSDAYQAALLRYVKATAKYLRALDKGLPAGARPKAADFGVRPEDEMPAALLSWQRNESSGPWIFAA
jgi:ppGpp synthetase/RelA/SpoT-type nucleotidyltranferase